MAPENEYLEEKKPLNQIQYASKDFPSYFDALLARLKDEYGDIYNDYASSSLGVMFINIAAYAMSQLAWYLDRQASDTYLSTTRTLSAATRLALQVGYKPKPAAAATADVTLTFAATSVDAIIPEGFRFQGPSDLIFVATADVVVAAGSTSAIVNVTEAAFREIDFASSGLANQRFSLTGILTDTTYVGDTSVRVYVNGLEWTEHEFIEFEKTNQFEVSYTADPPYVQFGDAQAGNIPSSGADILIKYRLIHGSNGNVKSGSIAKALSSFMVDGSSHTIDSAINPEGASGGADPETLLSVKRNAPKVFQTRKSAITQKDYDALVNAFADPTFGSVSKGYAAVIRNTSTDATTIALINAFLAALTQFQTTADPLLAQLADNSSQAANDLTVVRALLVAISDQDVDMQGLVSTSSDTLSSAFNAASSAKGAIDEAYQQITHPAVPYQVANSAVIAAAKDLLVSASASLTGFTATETAVQGNLSDIAKMLTAVQTSIVSENESLPLDSSLIDWVLKYEDILGPQASTDFAAVNASEAAMAVAVTDGESALIAHLNTLFSADCKVNQVNVPILVLGTDGFYAGPSAGLVRAVQTYLDGVKDVTHQVSVISGADALIGAHIQVTVKLSSAYVESELKSNIESGIDGLLKGRNFHESLYLSDLYDALEPIAGLEYVNIEITQPADHLDLKGNLIMGELEIVTKGSVTITTL